MRLVRKQEHVLTSFCQAMKACWEHMGTIGLRAGSLTPALSASVSVACCQATVAFDWQYTGAHILDRAHEGNV